MNAKNLRAAIDTKYEEWSGDAEHYGPYANGYCDALSWVLEKIEEA